MSRPDFSLARIRRILVINVARIGDTLLVVPVLRALRLACPAAEIVCLGHPKRIEAISGLPYVDRLAGITKRSAWLRGRWKKNFDLALVYGREAALTDYALRAARRVVALKSGNADRDSKLFAGLDERRGLHAVADRLRWLEPLGIVQDSPRLDFRVTATEARQASRWLETNDCLARPLIGFQVASFPTKAYRNWPMENFRALGARILSEYPQARLLILGGQADAAPAAALARALGSRAHSPAGQLDLRQTAALMQRLDLYVGVDTGPTHLAGALGIPMVALYHCLHRGRQLAPLDHPAYLGVVEHPAPEAEASAARTMDEISVDAVWAHASAALTAWAGQS